MKSQPQLGTMLWYACILLGIECGSGFVGRGWTVNNALSFTVKRTGVGGQRQRGSPESINSFQSRSLLSRARNKDTDADDGNMKDSSRRKSEKNVFISIFSDVLNRRKDDDDEDRNSADGDKKKKPDKQRTKIKQQSDREKENSARSSNGWFRRFFSDGKADQPTSKAAISSKTLLLDKDRTSKERSQLPPPTTPSTPANASSINKLVPNLVPMGSTIPRKAMTAKQKKLDEKNQSPPPFNPLLYIQTAWKNTAATFFESDTKDEWFTVFPTSGIMPGESVPITVQGLDLLVVASLDGRSLYCIANSCPHLGTPLETGQLTRLPMEEPSSTGTTFPGPDIFVGPSQDKGGLILSETQVSEILSQDGCEDCIICPLHRTAFALRSGAVRGDWCPYPPVLGPALGMIKSPRAATTYDIRTRGKNVQVKLWPANASSNTVSS